MKRKGPQSDRCKALREHINSSVAGNEKLIGPASDDIRNTAVGWLSEAGGGKEPIEYQVLALAFLAASAHGLLAATARQLDMPLSEVEDVFDELVRSPGWRRN